MTVEELRNHYKTGYQFEKHTGMSETSFQNWIKWGYIPIASQFKIEHFTKGALRASIKDARTE